MARSWLVLAFALAFLASSSHAAIVDHTFRVGRLSVPRICQPGQISITAVNGQLPGPEIEVHEGDTVVIHVVNHSPYNLTVHWHGIFQRGTPWADGPEMVTQCPIRPGFSYTYRFNVTGQEGTLWWHAHSSFIRATVHGALIIRPRRGEGAYPFPKPDKEETILLGEWWNDDTVLLEREAFLSGLPTRPADAYTINGKPGDYCNRSTKTNRVPRFEVRRYSSYLLRIMNAALNTPFFYKVMGHTFTVVAVDASYTTPYETDVIVIAPGQTVDALMVADASPGRYYMAISPYQSAFPVRPFNANTTAAVVEYVDTPDDPEMPVMPTMPAPNDTTTAHSFYTGLTALVLPDRPTVPLVVDTSMFVTVGFGLSFCQPAQTMCNESNPLLLASMNNASFSFPTTISMLEAHYQDSTDGVYTRDFPDQPPIAFDYTNQRETNNTALMFTGKSTKVRTVKYNATVEMVLQNTALVGVESHPMHLHGFNFFVLAQGFGSYDPATAMEEVNLINPQVRNTIAVPTGGWAVIRFVADNPGIWIMHCHIDAHLPLGLAMAFEVESGPTPETALPPPPIDYPQC